LGGIAAERGIRAGACVEQLLSGLTASQHGLDAVVTLAAHRREVDGVQGEVRRDRDGLDVVQVLGQHWHAAVPAEWITTQRVLGDEDLAQTLPICR
jgi:hypothetical protein